MPKETKITCDYCKKDLTTVASRTAYRLHLSSEVIQNTAMTTLTVRVYPPIKEDAYFCGLSCLRRWVNGDKPSQEELPGGVSQREYPGDKRDLY